MERKNSNSFFKIKEELKNSEFNRTFSHWTAEEDQELISLHTQMRLSNLEIAKRHRRTVGSIKARLKLHGYPDKNPGDFAIQFANYLKHGINPITGEVLSEDSAWLHPKIISDLDDYNQKSENSVRKNEKIPDMIETILHERERTVFQSLFNQIEIFLPNITVRDARLLKYLYSNVDRKITLQETADQFQISRERVRQIRDKALRKLNQSIRLKRYLQNSASSSGYLTKQDALKYLDGILETLHTGNSEESENPKIKNNHRNSNPSLNVGKTWTEDEETKLISMWKSGHSFEEIANQLRRLRGGVRSRLKRLGMLEEHSDLQDTMKTSNSELLSNEQKTLIKSEETDFFRIEKYETYTPTNPGYLVNENGEFTIELIDKLRNANFKHGRLLNSGFPVTQEEINLILKFKQEQKSLSEMETFFQRSIKSIRKIIEENNG